MKFPPETKIIVKDSVVYTTITKYRDTTIFIHLPAEIVTNTDTVYIGKDGLVNSKKSYLITSFAESYAQVVNSRLQHTLIQNDTLLSYTVKDAVRETWEKAEKYYKEQQQTVIKVKYVPIFYKIMMWIAFGLIALIIGNFLIKILVK